MKARITTNPDGNELYTFTVHNSQVKFLMCEDGEWRLTVSEPLGGGDGMKAKVWVAHGTLDANGVSARHDMEWK